MIREFSGGVALTTGVQNLPATNLVVVVIFMPPERKGVKDVKQLTYVYIHMIYVLYIYNSQGQFQSDIFSYRPG